jgi:lipooligosaccharide transport system permease protein
MTATTSSRRGTLLARLTPPVLLAGRRADRVVERNLLVYRHSWMIIFSGFFEPLFYLLSVGLGIGALVGDVTFAGQTLDYAEFVAPGLLASAAMNGSVYESTMNIFFKLKQAKTYDAILATPLGIADVTLGEITFSLMRGAVYGVAFCIVATAMGLILSPWAVLAVPAAVLIGFAFAAVGMASTSYMRTWQDIELVQLAVLPLFLFSATFYPLATYPRWLQIVVQCTPLYQGVALLRGLTTGVLAWSMLVNVAYLLVMGAFGVRVATRKLGRLLLP